jgi:hypothetical protein
MKIIANVLGVLFGLIGLVWFFQGIGVLPGSFMSGQTRWAVYGSITCLVGVGLLVKLGVRNVILNTVGVIVLLMGTIWILQGVNVLPGSMMSGQSQWAVRGAILDLVGIVLLVANRRMSSPDRSRQE